MDTILDLDEDQDPGQDNHELYILLKSFNKLDNYIAKYIYLKYIETPTINSINSLINNSDDNQDNTLDTLNTPEIKYKYSRKPSNQEEYKKYIHKIFKLERPNIISQKESLEKELQTVVLADEEYDKDPKKFIKIKNNSLPNIQRCSFIRKHKNKYKRCANRIVNDDSDMCYKHLESPNIYWDRWCKIIDEIKK